MRKASGLTFVLADHTKFGDSYMAKFADFTGDIDYLITDRLPDELNNQELYSSTRFVTTI